jgi:calcineurin-like phosphoesterase family protein
MKYFVTSDHHFNHANIIRYCGRPFKTVAHMNERMIKNWNERVKAEDTVFHLGDFQFRNSAGGNLGNGLPMKDKDEFWRQLNGHIVHVRGNHDQNNAKRSIIENMVIAHAGLRIGMVHDPSDFLESVTWNVVDFNLCGHVHQNWKHVWRGQSLQHLIVNVGVDVWKFYPMTLEEVVGYRAKIMKEQVTYQQKHEHNRAMDSNYHKGEVNEQVQEN